jgi:hypothetical protein
MYRTELDDMNINRGFMETLTAYVVNQASGEMDDKFTAHMNRMGGERLRSTLESLIKRWEDLTKDQRLSLAGVESIDLDRRLPSADLSDAIASVDPFPAVSYGVRMRSLSPELDLLSDSSSPSIPPRSTLMDAEFDAAKGVLPGTILANYRIDWAGVYCIKETPWDQGSPSDEIYVIFTTMQPFRQPWTQISNIEGNWDSGDDWKAFPNMSLFGETGPEKPAETAITATVMEHDFGDPNKYRDEIHAIATAAQAYAAANGIPIPDVAVNIVADIINGLLDTGDDHLGTNTVVVDPLRIVWYSQQALKHYKIQLDYHFECICEGGGAKYQVFYRVVQDSNSPVCKWTQIGGPVKELYAGGLGLFATNPSTNDIYHFEGVGESWSKSGGAGASFAVTNHDLYGLSSDKSAVYRMTSPGNWEQVGGPAGTLVGGGNDLYAQEAGENGAIWKYTGSPMQWLNIGGPGYEFAQNNLTLYGLSPDRGAVYEYLGTPGSWVQIGGQASKIIAGGPFLFALTPNGDSIWRYEGSPFKWTKIGGPWQSFAACDAGLFALSPNKTEVFWHAGPPDQWIRVGGAAGALAASGSHLYAASPTFQGVYMLD